MLDEERAQRTGFHVFGHRGSPQVARENTIESLTAALDENADGFETDLRRIADGSIVLYHDSDIAGVPLSTMDLETLRGQAGDVALLSDLAALAPRGTIILEVKEDGIEEDLVEIVRDWPNVIICSFHHAIIERLAGRGESYELGLTVREYRMDLAQKVDAYEARWFFPRWDVIDEEQVEAFHGKGLKVVPWTANRRTQWDRIALIGCDGVMTDVPGAAVRWRDSIKAGS